MPNVRLVAPHTSSHELIRRAEAIAVISSTVGLEALLYGKPVLTLGQPFYSGYGVTRRRRLVPRDPRRRAGAAALHARPRAHPAVPARGDARAATRASRCSSTTPTPNARTLAALAATPAALAAPVARRADLLRVAYEQTGLELDATGSARAARELRARAAARDDVELVALAHPPAAAAGGVGARAGSRADLVPVRARRARAATRAARDVLHCPMPLGAAARRVPPPVVSRSTT